MDTICLFLGGVLSLTSQHLQSARHQAAAVQRIEHLGGTVLYDFQVVNRQEFTVDPKAKSQVPSILLRHLGRDLFHDVWLIDLTSTNVQDSDLESIGRLAKLENLSLSKTRITGAGLAHLEELQSLRCLCLWQTPIDDTALMHIADLVNLEQLLVSETNVTDAGLIHLERLTRLEKWLGLDGTQVTDRGLERLVNLKRLRALNVRFTPVTPNGARLLQKALPKTEISVETVSAQTATR
jgi:hypothetical protein